MVLKKIIENYNNKHVSVAPSPLRNHNHPVHAEPGLEPDHEVPGDGRDKVIILDWMSKKVPSRTMRKFNSG